MMIKWSEVKIYIKPGVTDFRKQINGLSVIVEEQMGLAVFDGSLYLFCNKQRNKMKALYWDKNGFCLWMKRLEHDKFPWPHDLESVQEITPVQLKQLLTGIDFFHMHKQMKGMTQR